MIKRGGWNLSRIDKKGSLGEYEPWGYLKSEKLASTKVLQWEHAYCDQ